MRQLIKYSLLVVT